MTVPSLPAQRLSQANGTVHVDGATLVIRELRVTDPQTTQLARNVLSEHGPDVLLETLKQALVIGVLATTAAGAAADTSGAFAATLAGLASNVESTAQRTLSGLESVLGELDKGQRATTAAIAATLAELPERIERALSGEATTVRDAVRTSVADVQQRALINMQTALLAHGEVMRSTMSSDNPASPVALLRREFTGSLDTMRAEIMTGLAAVQAAQSADAAAEQARAKLSPAKGKAWEQVVIDAVAAACTATGDLWADSSGTPGEGSTAKTGDLVIGLTGPNVPAGVRICLESKNRPSKAFSIRELITLAQAAAQNRRALGCLILVPDPDHLPSGSGRFLKLGPLSWAVAVGADDPELFHLVLSVVRQLVLSAALSKQDSDGKDYAAAVLELQQALALLSRFDDLNRSTGNARKNLDDITKVAEAIRKTLNQHLTKAADALRE